MKRLSAVRTIGGLAFGLLLAVASGAARADSLTLNLGTSLNGTAPTGTAPWATMTFTSTTAGTVDLSISNNMPEAEFIPVLVFNTTVPSANLSNISISQTPTGPQNDGVTIGTGLTGDPSIQAGNFNIQLDWATANNSNRFKGGKTVDFTITDTVDKITAASFDAVSTGTPGGYYAAAKVQGIPGSKSGTIVAPTATVPEPSSGVLGLLGLAGASSLVWYRRRKSS